MLSPPPQAASIPAYNDFRAPTEADARAALQRVFGAERGDERWSAACRASALTPGRVHGAPDLQRAVEALATLGGPSAAVARSIQIRMRTHTRLAAKSLAMTDGGRA